MFQRWKRPGTTSVKDLFLSTSAQEKMQGVFCTKGNTKQRLLSHHLNQNVMPAFAPSLSVPTWIKSCRTNSTSTHHLRTTHASLKAASSCSIQLRNPHFCNGQPPKALLIKFRVVGRAFLTRFENGRKMIDLFKHVRSILSSLQQTAT